MFAIAICSVIYFFSKNWIKDIQIISSEELFEKPPILLNQAT